jgi:hypothetical protein
MCKPADLPYSWKLDCWERWILVGLTISLHYTLGCFRALTELDEGDTLVKQCCYRLVVKVEMRSF